MTGYQIVSEAMRTPNYLPTLKKIQSKGIRFAIIGSYALRHVRPLHDLDIIMHKQDWGKLKTLNLGTFIKLHQEVTDT